MSDRLTDTLTTLRPDAERVALPESSAVRRRGDQRTRRQAVGTALAAVALVAGAVGISGQLLRGNDEAAPPPVATQPAPEVTQHALAEDPFLRTDDMGVVGPYEVFQRAPQPTEEQPPALECMSTPATWGAAETRSQLFFTDLDATFQEHVLRYPDADAAKQAENQLAGTFASCDPGDPAEGSVQDRGPVPVPGSAVAEEDDAMRASRLFTPSADGGLSYYELGMIRSGNVLVVLEWSSMGHPEEDESGWVWTPQRLDQAMARALG